MTTPDIDRRSPERRLRDEQIAAEASLAPLELPPDATPSPMEAHLGRNRRRPMAVTGIVENGLVRPLDTAIKLPEQRASSSSRLKRRNRAEHTESTLERMCFAIILKRSSHGQPRRG